MEWLNVQADLRSRLESALGGVPVRVTVPAERPAELVVVRREGGRRINELLDRAGIGVTVWAGSEARAARLAHDVEIAMQRLTFADGYEVVEQEFSGSDPDPDTGSPRWYMSYTVTVHNLT
jgi:hypothetical protein